MEKGGKEETKRTKYGRCEKKTRALCLFRTLTLISMGETSFTISNVFRSRVIFQN